MNFDMQRWIVLVLSIALAGSAIAGDELPIYDGVGSDFVAMSTLDREVRLSEYRGQVVLLFFGYTSCQDICPTTLAHLRTLTAQLGEASERVQVLFVTVDPETDTAEHLKDYLARFDPRFVGITGSEAIVSSIAKSFLVQNEKSHGIKTTTAHHKAKTYTDQSFLYAHSQQIYLLDRLGRTRSMFFAGSPIAEMDAAIRSLLEAS